MKKHVHTDLWVVSVPHSGSNFTNQLLENKMGYKHAKGLFLEGDYRLNRKTFPVTANTLVIPLRHPEANWKSWKHRYEGVNDVWEHNHFLQWKALERIVNEDDCIFLPIDTPDREEYLQALRERSGKDLQTDWGKVNTAGTPKSMQCDKDLSYVWEIDFIKEIYGEQMK